MGFESLSRSLRNAPRGAFRVAQSENACDTSCERFVSDRRRLCAPPVASHELLTRNGSAGPSPWRARLRRAPCSCPPAGGHVLKALVTGLCALVLCATPAAARAGSSADLGAQLAKHVETLQKSSSVIRFFEKNRWLLSDPRFEKEASLRLGIARRTLAATQANADRARAALARREADAERKRLLADFERSPEKAICHAFGSYCRQALQVARCESGVQTTAQNGQYLGLFQMGSSERRLFGHGESAIEQAQAAYRYFVRSGRDWSPWSCKPWY